MRSLLVMEDKRGCGWVLALEGGIEGVGRRVESEGEGARKSSVRELVWL